MQTLMRRWRLTACLCTLGTMALAQAPLVESRFDLGDDGWTIVNLASDYRELDVITFDGACMPAAVGGAFLACDPDAGTWMFEAPAKFLGDQSVALDGSLEYRLRWQGEGDMEDPLNLPPHVILVNSNTASGLAYVFPAEPPINVWTDLRIALDEHAGWRWMDDTTGMEDLPPATREQMDLVLSGLTGLRIRGEFITGDDSGYLSRVALFSPPRLGIRRTASGQVEISWPPAATNFVLTVADRLGGAVWSPIDTGGETTWVTAPTNQTRFFRLRRD